MINHHRANLAEAHAAMERLLPHLPWPRLSEFMSICGVALPRIGNDENLPMIEQPEALIGNIGQFIFRKLPKQWLPAYFHHQHRLRRNAQLVRLLPLCLAAELSGDVEDHHYAPDELDNDADGIVAGVILLALRPMPGPLRAKLTALTQKHWFGSFLALHGVVFADEATPMLAGVACDPRLAAALWRENHDLAEPLAAATMRRNDLWSATIALNQPLAGEWIGRVGIFGANNSIAAATALVLQPMAPAGQKAKWIQRLKQCHPRLSYLATRWARHTWPSGWEALRDELRENCVRDRGQIFYHWYRDCEVERVDDALRETEADTLWQAELINHAKNSGQELRRLMVQRLRDDVDKNEAQLTLRWLDHRGRP